MKKKLVVLATLASAMTLAACGGGSSKKGGGEISIWVGNESVNFYRSESEAFLAQNPDFGYKIKVVASDTGTIAGAMQADNTACGDIITAAHDNIGKLAESALVKVLSDQSLLDQIEADNPDEYKDVIKSKIANSEKQYVIGSPYISQALFLMYNKQHVSAEQAKTFEGLKQAAEALRTPGNQDFYGCTITGTDGFNFSFPLLARKVEDNSTTLKIYEGLNKLNCFCQGEDTVAVTRWAQDSFSNGTLIMPNSSGFATMMQNKTALSVVGGAWQYNAVVSAIGKENVGITVIPKFTLTSAHVAGTTFAANTEMRGGTFADCKCFLINAASDKSKYQAEQQLIKYLSSKDVQNRSFKAAMNVPAYKGAQEYIESIKNDIEPNAYEIAKAQSEMAKCGIPQPFVTATLNNYYYQNNAPDIYKNVILLGFKNQPSEIEGAVKSVRQVLYTMEYIWKWGSSTVEKIVMPDTFPGDTSVKFK